MRLSPCRLDGIQCISHVVVHVETSVAVKLNSPFNDGDSQTLLAYEISCSLCCGQGL